MSNRTGPMVCPVDQTQLVMSDRQGIEIDYCPTCRGVWLDRGELDKIIDRAQPAALQPAPAQQPAPQPQSSFAQPGPGAFSYPERGYEPRRYEDDRHKHQDYRHRKRKGFLGELFDFD